MFTVLSKIIRDKLQIILRVETEREQKNSTRKLSFLWKQNQSNFLFTLLNKSVSLLFWKINCNHLIVNVSLKRENNQLIVSLIERLTKV